MRSSLALVSLALCACTTPTGDGVMDAGRDSAIFGGDAPFFQPDTFTDTRAPSDAWTRADSGPLDDSQVLGIVHAMNEHVIGLAQMASTNAGRPSVRAFALQIIDAHHADETRLANIANGAAFVAIESNASADIEAQTNADLDVLQRQTGIDVDLVFLGELQSALGQYSARMTGLVAVTTNADLATEITAEAQSFQDESSMCDVVRGGSPEAGLDYDGGPPVDAGSIGIDS